MVAFQNKSTYKVRREQKLIYSIVIRIGRRIAADARNASNLFVTVGLIQVRHDDPVPTALLFKSYLPGAIFDHNNGIDKTVSSCKMHEDRFFFSLCSGDGYVKVTLGISRSSSGNASPCRASGKRSVLIVIFPEIPPSPDSTTCNFRFVFVPFRFPRILFRLSAPSPSKGKQEVATRAPL